MTVRALAGETVDALVWRVLGLGAEAVGRVYEANPNLADAGLFLTRDQPVTLPVSATTTAAAPLVQLWD
ncbi:MAG: phage tail protein [Brevundimonas sp.]|nr:MAG: phage tail protein [Brevundimonas sp.]